MDALDTLLLSRMQFAANITFHILFPTITIALGWVLLFMRWRWLRTQDHAWLAAYRLWTKVFALSFALGVVSGVTMSFQFGTNWPGYMERVGNIAGPLLAYEVLTAFFLEASFLGIMLFGHGRVSERVHMMATFLVAFGTTMSAFWILSLNSWMQTPTGHEIVNGEFFAVDWWQIVFNPSFPYRLTHMLLASGLTVSFLIAGTAAWQLLRGRDGPATGKMLRLGVTLGAVLIPAQIVMGDLHGLNTLEHQPQKVAAMEGLWETTQGAPLLLFAIPDEATRSNHFEVAIPKLASLILTHELDGTLRGLNDFETHPPVAPVFYAFRVMVGTGMLMLLVSWLALWQLRRHGWQARALPKWTLHSLRWMTFSGWLATVAGWYVTEIGRQPYMVQDLLKVASLVTPTPAPTVGATLAAYVTLYLALLVAYVGVLRYLASKPMAATPAEDEALPASAMIQGGAAPQGAPK